MNDAHPVISSFQNTAVDVPAYQQNSTAKGVVTMRFTISTEKLGGMVLLRVDAAKPQGPAATHAPS